MEFLPKVLGTRPRLAVEVRAEGVVAARAEDATGVLTAVARVDVAEGSLVPGLKAGNVTNKARLTAAVRSALDAVAGPGTGSGRSRDATVIVPDAATRILLLDFDSLPGKAAEAMPVVRFRLKKLLPFEVEDAVVSYQVMSTGKDLVTVLAVAIPRQVLAEYEGIVTAAGYVPGAVLPSTLAALAGSGANGQETSSDPATLVVNTGVQHVTTAIERDGVLLLHRTLEMNESTDGSQPANEDIDRIDVEAAMQARQVAKEVAESAGGSFAWEVAQAVSVAAAYFEDTLGVSPERLLAAGTTSAESLERMLRTNGLEGLRVREMMTTEMLAAGAATASVPRGWLTGVRGALTS